MRTLVMTAVMAFVMAGCATTQQQTVAVDTFCGSPASKKRAWNLDMPDDQKREVATWNSYVDRRCGIPGLKA